MIPLRRTMEKPRAAWEVFLWSVTIYFEILCKSFMENSCFAIPAVHPARAF